MGNPTDVFPSGHREMIFDDFRWSPRNRKHQHSWTLMNMKGFWSLNEITVITCYNWHEISENDTVWFFGNWCCCAIFLLIYCSWQLQSFVDFENWGIGFHQMGEAIVRRWGWLTNWWDSSGDIRIYWDQQQHHLGFSRGMESVCQSHPRFQHWSRLRDEISCQTWQSSETCGHGLKIIDHLKWMV